jgi:hypothetical protein
MGLLLGACRLHYRSNGASTLRDLISTGTRQYSQLGLEIESFPLVPGMTVSVSSVIPGLGVEATASAREDSLLVEVGRISCPKRLT